MPRKRVQGNAFVGRPAYPQHKAKRPGPNERAEPWHKKKRPTDKSRRAFNGGHANLRKNA